MTAKNKIIIYQVLPRLFGNNKCRCIYNGDIVENGCGKMSDFTLQALKEIKKIGATHIWYTGIIEHVSNFFAPSSRFGTPDELKELIDVAHTLGIAVIMSILQMIHHQKRFGVR